MGYLAALFLLVASAAADVVYYEGRLRVEGVPFQGEGRFNFALVGDQGATLWASSEMRLDVRKGAYAVRLGDSAQAPTIDAAVLRRAPAPRLRISFFRDGKGWAVAGGDVALNGGRPGIPIAVAAPPRPPSPPPRPPSVTVSTAGAPSLGMADARLVLVEFTDFRDPLCLRFQKEVFEPFQHKYLETGKLRIVTRHLPRPLDPAANQAARAGFCAGVQGRFWPMRERLFAANGELPVEVIRQAAQEAALDLPQFDACLDGAESRAAIAADAQLALAAGIVRTPAFILGPADGDRVTGLQITGPVSLASLAEEIERQLASGGQP